MSRLVPRPTNRPAIVTSPTVYIYCNSSRHKGVIQGDGKCRYMNPLMVHGSPGLYSGSPPASVGHIYL